LTAALRPAIDRQLAQMECSSKIRCSDDAKRKGAESAT
jgi:hypothetical protein